MSTIETDIWNALKARIATLPTSIVPQNAIALPKAVFTKPASGDVILPYIEVRQLPNQSDRVLINRPLARRLGILQLDYLSPLNEGLTAEQAIQQAGLIAEHFPGDLKMRSGDLLVQVEQAPDVGRGLEDKGYWRIPVSVRYVCYA
jgi:hypothetical protein